MSIIKRLPLLTGNLQMLKAIFLNELKCGTTINLNSVQYLRVGLKTPIC